ncbi:hypothetical protein QNH46_21085 [Paenibacillus woosongensis]|uniref:Aminoacyl-tRNA synthetase class II (G/ P/ S/T) domain-containing protein n=1 Tax=Paenibacillus woosongensis TaxID=307580 RepID=A0AA95L0M9_9BACL|nr:aminoacyl--tRNA ligase-related protein [Paenibacillus woosongensis]WHX48534.1 hypothetical protein QNH46_21085 [Paenibacillus woosongensis]
MFKKYQFELNSSLNDLGIKRFCYQLLQHASVHKVYVDQVDHRKVTVHYLETKKIGEIRNEIDRFLTHHWYAKEQQSVANDYESVSNEEHFESNDLCSCTFPVNDSDISAELLRTGWIKMIREQDLQFSVEIIRLLEWFDTSYVSYISERLHNVTEVKHNSLIPKYYMEKMNYFQSSPKHLFFPSHLNNDSLDQFTAKTVSNNGKLPNDVNLHLDSPNYVLQSAPCFKIYFSLENQNLEHNQIYNIRGECYRNEGKRIYMMERLNQFSMREFIFIGTPEFVIEHKRKILQWTIDWMEKLGIKGHCAHANDPFFIDDQARNNFNIPSNIKVEVKAEIPYKQDSLSIASFDTHGDFFSKTFNFNMANQKETWSGCMGLGIERCVWSFLQQYGLNCELWPEAVRDLVYA